MARQKQQLTPEQQARAVLPRTTTMRIGTHVEVQVGAICYMFQYTSNEPPYGKWQLVEENSLAAKRGRPKKQEEQEIKPVIKSGNVHTEQELANINKSTGLVHEYNEEIDGVQIPVFKRNKLLKSAV